MIRSSALVIQGFRVSFMVDQEFLDSLVFRKARLSDAGKVVRLVRELVGDVSEAATRKRFRRLVLRPSYINFLFLHDGKPIALWLGREGYFLGADAPYLQAIGLVVDPEYQRQGLASALAQTGWGRMIPVAPTGRAVEHLLN